MSKEDEGFLKRLLATFKLEAQEHLGAMSRQLLALEGPAAAGAAGGVETLFREAHSLKGAARAVNLADIEQLCQAMERVLSSWKREEVLPSPALFDALHAALDALAQLLAHHVDGAAKPPPMLAVDALQRLSALLAAPSNARPAVSDTQASMPASAMPEPASSPDASHGVVPVIPAPLAPGAETVRVATAKLDALMIQVEDLQALKFSGAHLGEQLRALGSALLECRRQTGKSARHARVLRRAGAKAAAAASTDALTQARNKRLWNQSLDALESQEIVVKALCDRFARIERGAANEQRHLAVRAERLLDDMKQALMLPFSSVTEGLPKLVRDLAAAGGKRVDIEVHGASLEIDRRVLEQLKAPLVHLVRNAVDHGIESPHEREQQGKPARGRIRVDIAPSAGNRVELMLSDDGAGIALDKVLAKAQAMGLVPPTAAANANPSLVHELVFASGLSTSPILTDLSGHGLGLAIAREKIERMGGSIVLAAPSEGVGARFAISLPAMLATFRGLRVVAVGQQFVLPSRQVERVGRVAVSALQRSPEGLAVELDGRRIAFVPLAAVLALPSPAAAADAPKHRQYVVLGHGDKRIAFGVDDVLDDDEVMVKPLAAPLQRVRHVAGATVLGTGRVVPVLDVAELLKTAARAEMLHAASIPAVCMPASGVPPRSLLVAEDSITSRTLLKEILESAGYRVSTAADGIDALTSLQSGEFDLLVSDVEMPRLDGFDLTARVRTDKRLAGLPVVLVTALDSREDKQRGIDVGANAYILKSGFDSRRLLETIRTLI